VTNAIMYIDSGETNQTFCIRNIVIAMQPNVWLAMVGICYHHYSKVQNDRSQWQECNSVLMRPMLVTCHSSLCTWR
jgi:hypothetical protein